MKARLLALAVGATLLLAGCGSSSSSSSGDDSAAEPEVGFSVAKLTDQFQVLMVKQVEEQAKKQNVNLLPTVNANADPAKQNDDVATLLTRGVKGLIVGPIDSKAIVPAIEKANAAGVPVVTIDSGADGGNIYMTVKADNKYMGTAACEALASKIGSTGTVLNLQGDLKSTNGRDRSDGFTECMSQKLPGVTVISKPMDWDPAKCSTIAETVLSTQKIDGIYAGSEIICLKPVADALKKNGLLAPAGDPKHVPFVAVDGSPDGHQAIRDGYLDALISQPLDGYGQWAVYWINQAVQGKTPTEGPTDHDSVVVKDGSSYSDLLKSPTVTKDNVDDPSLWGNG